MSTTEDKQAVKVVVCVTDDAAIGSSPIINARVWGDLTSSSPASGGHENAQNQPQNDPSGNCPPAFKGTTDTEGRVIFYLEAGTYEVFGEAFGLTDRKTIEVDATCDVMTVNLENKVGFEVESRLSTEECQTPVVCTSNTVFEGSTLIFEAKHRLTHENVKYSWSTTNSHFLESANRLDTNVVHLDTTGYVGDFTVMATLSERGSASINYDFRGHSNPRPVQKIGGDLTVSMKRAATMPTEDLPLWVVIRKSTEAISFNNYFKFMNFLLCGESLSDEFLETYEGGKFGSKARRFEVLKDRRFLPFTDAEAYRILKVATEAFLIVNCGVRLNEPFPFALEDFAYVEGHVVAGADLDDLWDRYLEHINGTNDLTLPYLALIRDKLRDVRLMNTLFEDPGLSTVSGECYGILTRKLTAPCLLELIWSYWHEEGMLVQASNAISRRFQNVRGPSGIDPLANLEIDPLRPLNNLLWGYIQDEQHRLSVVRRTYEYDHHYGLRLDGKAVPKMRPADSRSKFLEAFHNLLNKSTLFFRQDDDTTVVADGFPLLNALQEVHLILSQGAHNQFGDLPSTARIEMMMQQWLLARPEFREFLPTRIMVAYPEPWMDRVDAMKKSQGWTDTSVLHFRNLGMFGEQILLSIRYGAWGNVTDPASATNWARFWRPEIQGYIHSYRAATGVDLTSKTVDFTLPSIHLRKRLALQQKKT